MYEASLFHDLRNKLAIVYTMLNSAKAGLVLNDEHVNAVVKRIDEILVEMAGALNMGHKKPCLETLCHDSFSHFVKFTVRKLSTLYPEIKITLREEAELYSEDFSVAVSKAKLYQVIENAVENSRNALSSNVLITVTARNSQPTLTLADDGEGFGGPRTQASEARKASGLKIIGQNLSEMNAVGAFSDNRDGGATLTITFPALDPKRPPQP